MLILVTPTHLLLTIIWKYIFSCTNFHRSSASHMPPICPIFHLYFLVWGPSSLSTVKISHNHIWRSIFAIYILFVLVTHHLYIYFFFWSGQHLYSFFFFLVVSFIFLCPSDEPPEMGFIMNVHRWAQLIHLIVNLNQTWTHLLRLMLSLSPPAPPLVSICSH